MAKDLTGKQKAFADAYIMTLNGTESARRAKYKGDDKALSVISHENLRKPSIRAYIDSHFKEREMSAIEVIERLTSLATGSLEDFINEETGRVDLSKARARGKMHLLKKYKVKEGPPSKTTGRSLWKETEIELYPSDTALDRISRIMGLDKQVIEVNHKYQYFIDALKDKRVTPEQVREAAPTIADELFKQAGMTVE